MAQIPLTFSYLSLNGCVSVGTFTGESSSFRVDTAIIQKRLPVLHKYLNSDTERQLQALYALQALIVKLDQPPSEYELFFKLCCVPRLYTQTIVPFQYTCITQNHNFVSKQHLNLFKSVMVASDNWLK